MIKPHYTNHTVSIHFARAYLQRGRNLGLDCQALMEYAALPPALLADDQARLAPYQLARLLHTPELEPRKKNALSATGPC